jgi:PAS domain S-box-containing protein
MAIDKQEFDKLTRDLRESENRLAELMNILVDGLIVIDQHGIVRNFNPAAEVIFRYEAADVVGRNINMLMPADISASHDQYIGDYLETGIAKIIGIGREVTGLTRDGREFPMDLSVAEMMVDGARHFVGVVRDITERKEIESELRQAYKMEALGQLTGGVAHDFNNLLAVLMMDLEMLSDYTTDNEDATELVAEARDVTQAGANLTQRLLAFSRRQSLQPKVVDLNALISSIATLLRRTLGEMVEIDIVGPGDVWTTLVDPGQVENAILNLALNARDAMPGGGRLTIETANRVIRGDEATLPADCGPGEYVTIGIADTGSGMTPDVVERAFDPFFSTKEAGSGSGLGLSMVYGFVKQSGGSLNITSEIGRGTQISIYLPRAAQAVASNPEKDASKMAPGSETVLLVEDHPRLRRRARQALQGLGYRVVESETGEAALAQLSARDDIDLLFTDIVMPGSLDGIALARAARKIYPRLKVLFTTGYAEYTEISDELLNRDGDLLRKPYARGDLATTIRNLLDRRG